jgi:hypothetical protein
MIQIGENTIKVIVDKAFDGRLILSISSLTAIRMIIEKNRLSLAEEIFSDDYSGKPLNI